MSSEMITARQIERCVSIAIDRGIELANDLRRLEARLEATRFEKEFWEQEVSRLSRLQFELEDAVGQVCPLCGERIEDVTAAVMFRDPMESMSGMAPHHRACADEQQATYDSARGVQR